MFSGKRPRLSESLALRLTLWYAVIFAASSALAFAVVYALIASLLAERTDTELREDLDEYALHWRREGIARVASEMRLDTQGDEARKTYIRVWGSDGRELAATDLATWPAQAGRTVRALPQTGGGPQWQTHERVRTLLGEIGAGAWLEIGRTLEDDEALQREILRGFLASLAVVLALGAPVGWFMARRALHGVKEATRTAREIAAGALDRRVPVGASGDELDQLARTVNTMLDRIEALIVGMRDMADNLAHDLRSPLARIRACAEMSAANGDAGAGRQTWAAEIVEECDRLLEMLNTTLDIAEADAGAARLNVSRLDLAEIVATAAELFQAAAEDRRIRLTCSVPPHCWIEGDRQRLQRVIANLLDNALKYTPAGGSVGIALREQDAHARLTIDDTGVGIAAEHLPRIFQRFYRGDRGRSRHGTGLGLSLALAFVRAHGGDIAVASAPGSGSTFTVVLPRPGCAMPPLGPNAAARTSSAGRFGGTQRADIAEPQ